MCPFVVLALMHSLLTKKLYIGILFCIYLVFRLNNGTKVA